MSDYPYGLKPAKEWVGEKIKGGAALRSYAGFSVEEIKKIQLNAILATSEWVKTMAGIHSNPNLVAQEEAVAESVRRWADQFTKP